MNQERFLADQQRYFTQSYEGFLTFGGPSVYFHNECLKAGNAAFLADRHIEMLYATLTSWGMHRMGDPTTTKTKLADWPSFRDSIANQRKVLLRFRQHRMAVMSELEYSDAVTALKSCYFALSLSLSKATVVVNSKALFHLLPGLIPPIDRQFTLRFFGQPPQRWRDSKGKFRAVVLPSGADQQFMLFHRTCVEIKRLSDLVDPDILQEECQRHGVTTPKAMDNAIVNYVRIVSVQGSRDGTMEKVVR